MNPSCQKLHFEGPIHAGWNRVHSVDDVLECAGMYAVFGIEGELIYIGSSNNVRRRLMSYATSKRVPDKEYVFLLNEWLLGGIATSENSVDVRVWFGRDFGPWYGQHLYREARLIRRLQPKCNVTHRKSLGEQYADRVRPDRAA